MKRTQVFVLVAILLIGIGCVVYVVRVLRRGFSTRVAPGKIESSFALTMRDMAIPARYKTMNNPVTMTPEVVREGMAHWAARHVMPTMATATRCMEMGCIPARPTCA